MRGVAHRTGLRSQVILLAAVLGGLAFLSVETQAQVLERVDSLSRDGGVAEARSLLTEWWKNEAAGAGRAELQHAIWLRATLSLDAAAAVRDYRRLTVEYPGGPYSAEALLRIAQEAEARGSWVQAAEAMGTLVRDYPGSSRAQEARTWLVANRQAIASAREEDPSLRSELQGPPPPRTSGPPAAAATTEAPEPAHQQVPSASEPAKALSSAPRAESPAPAGDFAVQLGAFSTLERARALQEQVRRRGFEPRLVRVTGNELVRVRVGRFPEAGGALSLRERLRALGLEAIVVEDASREESLR